MVVSRTQIKDATHKTIDLNRFTSCIKSIDLNIRMITVISQQRMRLCIVLASWKRSTNKVPSLDSFRECLADNTEKSSHADCPCPETHLLLDHTTHITPVLTKLYVCGLLVHHKSNWHVFLLFTIPDNCHPLLLPQTEISTSSQC